MRGGLTEDDAQAEALHVPADRVLDVAPPTFAPGLSDPWTNPWLHVAEETAFEAWEHAVKAAHGYVEHLLDAHIEARQGDVNTTAVSSLRRATAGPQRLPSFSGKAAQPFAPLPEPDEWLEVPQTQPDTDPGRTLYRLAHLTTTESGIVMQEAANLHIPRRLRATWFERDAADSQVFLHALWRYVALPGHERAGKAILGYLSSALASYLFGMWATNFHVQANVLRRLPIPKLDSFPEDELAAATEDALAARMTIETLIRGTSGDFTGGSVTLDRAALLVASGAATQPIQTAQLNGSIELIPGTSMRVDRILSEDRLTASDEDYAAAVRHLLEPHKTRMWAQVTDVLIPTLSALVTWKTYLASKESEAASATAAFRDAIDRCDDAVFEWYGFPTGDLRERVKLGLPWGYRRARERHAQLVAAALP